MKKRLIDTDSADTVLFITLAVRIGPLMMLMLIAIEYHFYGFRFVWFVIPDLALTALIVYAVYWMMDRFSRGAGSIVLPSGKSTPFERQYSEQDALVLHGRLHEAVDSYRGIIADDPTNIEAQLRLGRLLENDLKDHAGAEECYRRIRGLTPSPQQNWLVSNALIDLYHASGQTEKLKAELSRLARQYTGTETGANARRRLDEITAASPPPAPDT